ncbi:MAG: polysaccharide biosynthesis protein [bacterium]
MSDLNLHSSYAEQIKDATILITGGTGSVGSAVAEALLTLAPKQVVIFSRDEQKQFDMRNRVSDPRLAFIVGDIRDRQAVDVSMRGVDYVFHAAALKQVPIGESFPLEFVKTNVLGSNNVIQSAIGHAVKRLVVLSTDKAPAPTSAMGMSKALMERVAIASARNSKTVVCIARFGNILYTRGSVVPYFIERIKQGQPITITDPQMTRFFMTLDQALDLILFALTSGAAGEIYVRKIPGIALADLALAIAELFSYKTPAAYIGMRLGERRDEFLISAEELRRAVDHGEYYRIVPESPDEETARSSSDVQSQGGDDVGGSGYGSLDARRLSKNEIKELLLSVPEIRSELAAYTAQ